MVGVRLLSASYRIGSTVSLQRLVPDLTDRFRRAFEATEADLRLWMPAAAKEQEDAASFIDSCVGAFDEARSFAYAIVVPAGDVIGYVNLAPTGHEAVVAYWVHPRWRGGGIAPTAVRVLVDAAFVSLGGVDRIRAHLDAANAASSRVLRKAGFEHHDTVRRPPRTTSESDVEWVFVRRRHGDDRDPRGPSAARIDGVSPLAPDDGR